MQVTAQLNNLRISPRKVRLVARAVRGMDAAVAKHQLDYIIKKSSKPISRLLDSAMSNAYNNLGLVKENLFIKDIVVNEGQKLKRFRPKGFGMASPIEKKTSRIKIVLEERVPGLKATKDKRSASSGLQPSLDSSRRGGRGEQEARAEEKQVETVQAITDKDMKALTEKTRPEVKKEIGKKGGIFGGMSGLGKKFFRRKAI